MPIHDWTRVPAGLFHHFHQDWTVEIARQINRGRLPAELTALVESGAVVSALHSKTRFIPESDNEIYSARANRIVIRHHLGRIVSVIEIVSPGNKCSKAALRDFVEKAVDFIRSGVHVLVLDVFPPTARDPNGIHKAIWDEIEEEQFALPSDKNRILVSYEAGRTRSAYIEPIGVGDLLPDMPLFLAEKLHIAIPLEATYATIWEALPASLRDAVVEGTVL